MTANKKYLKAFSLALLGSVFLVGCSKNDTNPPVNESKNESKSVDIDAGKNIYLCTGTNRATSATKKVNIHADSIDSVHQKAYAYFPDNLEVGCVEDTLYVGNAKAKSVSKELYKKIETKSDLIYYYHAKSNGPIPYEDIANTEYSDYSNQSDVFKKKEILDRIKPEIDSNISGRKNDNYVSFQFESSLSHFDMKSETFNLTDITLGDGYYISFNGDWKYKALMNGDKSLLSLKAKSLEDAKAIESTFKGESKRVSVKFYGQIMKAGEMNNSKNLVVEVTGFEVYDIGSSGRPVSKPILSSME